MLSPSDLVSRVGVGGGLLPFFKCVGVYFLAGGAGAAPGAAAVAAKCAPVLCLLAAVLLLPPRPPHTPAPAPPPHHQYHKDNRRYARLVGLGLAASALGDAWLVWPARLAGGMALFGVAHVCYTAAFWARAGRAGARAGAGGALLLGAALYCALVPAPPALAPLVPAYALLLAGMAWRALATRPPGPPGPGRAPARALAAPAGALLFVVSDAILGYSMFAGPVPHHQVLVMSTYYLGQLGIALSALLPPAPAPAPALTPARAPH